MVVGRFDDGQGRRRDNSASIVRGGDRCFWIFGASFLACVNGYWDSALDDHGYGYLLFHNYSCRNFDARFNFDCYRYFDDAINFDGLWDANESVYFYSYWLIDNLKNLLFDLNGLYQGPTYVNVA